MVVYKDKRYAKCSMFPNTDWLGNADFILDDNDERDAELEAKIISLYPNFEFVFDDNGQPVDVTETEPEPKPPEITTEQRMTAMENAMEEIINMLMEV